MPPRGTKRARTTLQSRIDAILADKDDDAGSKLCTASIEWDDGTEKDDFFDVLTPFVKTLDPESMEAQLFFESQTKEDATVLEEASYLVRSNVIDEEEEAEMKAAAPADRKRMLFVHLMLDADEEELVEGEEGEGDEDGEEDEDEEDGGEGDDGEGDDGEES